MKTQLLPILLLVLVCSASCESEQTRKDRLAVEDRQRIELQQQLKERQYAETLRLEDDRREQEKQAEADRLAAETYNKYISNSLNTGATPYSENYGTNNICNDYGCSQIKVETSNSDVLVTIKKNHVVVRHAFIRAGDGYTFSFPNGTYQAFFYYGKGWNPEKQMKNGKLKGGFISSEEFGKDEPQTLANNVLKYELLLQQNGNFSTSPSNPEEAL